MRILSALRALLALLVSTLLVSTLVAVPVVAQDDDPPPPRVTGLTEPVYEESVTEVYEIPTDHGTLYGEVIRPVVPDGVQVPVILTYSPYNAISQAATGNGSIADDGTAAFFVPRGYARAVFDVIGTRNSGGCYDYGGLGERETGAALVDALGTQAWSNGRVGMIGGSYDGTTQWAAAVEQPEHLAAIIPQVAIDRWYDYAFGGGIRYFLNSEDPTAEGFDTPLAFDFGFGFLPSVDPGRPSPDLTAEALAGRFNPCQRILHSQRAYEFDPVYDAFWGERDYLALADRITAPALVEGGWLDHNVKHWDSTRMFAALPADLPRHLVMGQWAHSTNRHADAQDLRHAWFDRWLLDLPTGVELLPLVDSQVGGTEERTDEQAWPPLRTAVAELPLAAEAAEGSTLALVGGGDLTWEEMPLPLPPTTEQEILSSDTSLRGTYLHLQTEPLDVPVRIAGSPTLTLELTTDAASTHLTPVLYERTADGDTAVITRGFLNARNRDGLDVSQPLEPGQPWTATVELWDVDFEVAEGSQLGLALSSGNAEWALPDDDSQGANTITGPSSLNLPINRGHAALGVEVPPVVQRLAGEGRTGTAAVISARTRAAADTVVLATSGGYADALAAGPLATALDAPLLLSGTDALDAVAAAEIRRLGATDAVLVGGASALSEVVSADLAERGLTVRRLAGPDRFATAAAVAAEVVALTGSSAAVVVEGVNTDPSRGWPDAVSAGPLAALTGAPILLTTTDALPSATTDALSGVGQVTIVGGQAAVSAAVAEAIGDGGATVRRVAGQTRYATSAAVHQAMVSLGADPSVVWLATAHDWPDALAAGPAAAAAGQVLLLIDGTDLDGSPPTRDVLGPSVAEARLTGGPGVISEAVAAQVRERLEGSTSRIG